jgi:hypothetical protein
MYTNTNFKTKKALKEAVADGHKIGVFQPGPFGGGDYHSGSYAVEGPHYPEPHRWYAEVIVRDGFITKVK